MTMTETNPASRNGVDTATLFATLDAVKQAPAAAQFQFRAYNEWINGTHMRWLRASRRVWRTSPRPARSPLPR